MSRLATILSLALLSGCAAPPAVEIDDSPEGKLASMTWLAGDWIGRSPKGVWEAHYTSPAGGVILSTNKEYVEGVVRSFEWERFAVEDGEVVVWPHPRGEKRVAFKLTELDREKQKAVFENPRYNFPQRLEYQRFDADTLVIKVTAPGEQPGKRKGFGLELKANGR